MANGGCTGGEGSEGAQLSRGGEGKGVTKGSVGTSRACPAIAIQIAATNAISIGFGQQVGEWEGEWEREWEGECTRKRVRARVRPSTSVVCLVNVYQTVQQPSPSLSPSPSHLRHRRLSHKLQFPFVSHHSYVLFE